MTNVIELDSGVEQRVARWNQARHKYNVSYGIKSYEQLYNVINFYIARRGIANGFRFKDFTDCTSAPGDGYAIELGGSTPTHLDQLLGVGDDTTQSYQLRKLYGGSVSGLITRWRTITMPVIGSVSVSVDDIDLGPEQQGWTVNPLTGIVFFDPAPPNGHDVKAGFQFEVPVRFGTDLDEVLSLSIDSFGEGSSQDIPLIEIVPDNELEDEFHYGGSLALSPSVETLIGYPAARVLEVDPQVNDVAIRLPPINLAGGPFFYVVNKHATNNLKVNTDEGNLIMDIPAGGFATFVNHHVDDPASNTWYGFA